MADERRPREQTAKHWIGRSLRHAGWAPLAVFVCHVAISLAGAYSAYPYLDIPMHLAGGVAIAHFFERTLTFAAEADLLGRPRRFVLMLLAFALTCSAAVFWEFAEWTFDRVAGASEQRGMEDTLLDMALGIAGAAVFLSAAARWTRRSSGGHMVQTEDSSS